MNDNNVKNAERRNFIRHPSDVPLEVETIEAVVFKDESLSNVSVGGLTFVSNTPFVLNSLVKIRIQLINPPFEAKGRIVWSSEVSGRYEIGVEFIETKDAFRARMVEQICHIEHYKREISIREGRSLSGREAALEWIGKFAGTFEKENFDKIEK
jgi:hypothetical protein